MPLLDGAAVKPAREEAQNLPFPMRAPHGRLWLGDSLLPSGDQLHPPAM
ncbi:hypothetical protein [Sphaerisporangium album]|nr:hypothetical protein [Sphaerisporangium album]